MASQACSKESLPLTPIAMTVNDQPVAAEVEPRMLLVDFLRETLGLTGTHFGCDTSQCGVCVVHVDGRSVKSCTMLAIQAANRCILTIEGLAADDRLHAVQAAFEAYHALQCGYCTPGMVLSAVDLIARHPAPDAAMIRTWLKGNLCRCTGYQNIVTAISAAARAALTATDRGERTEAPI